MAAARDGYAFRNWGRIAECRPKGYFQPETEEEVCETVRQVSEAGGNLRVVGAGHSWSPLCLTNGMLLNLDRLDRLVSIDQNKKQVTIGAGVRLKELNDFLPRYGLALENLGSIAEQSIAGAVSTGTHGTGLRIGNLSTTIVALNLVTGGGKLLRLSADRDPELMAAARLGLGVLGVITQVTIQCEPAYNLRLDAELIPFDRVLEQLEQLNKEHERVRLYWFPGTDVFYVMLFNRTEEPPTARNPVGGWFNDVVLRQGVMALMLRSGDTFPTLVESINRFQTQIGLRSDHRVARSDRALTVPMPPIHQEMEYAVPVERTVEALECTRELFEKRHYYANMPVEVRFVAADQNMLSPSYGRDVCYIGAYTNSPKFSHDYFDGFEIEMKKMGGRPHWGKCHRLTAAEARGLYPLFDRFKEIRRELDPNGVFANEWTRTLFG